jgi:hypothetical protein
MPREVRMSDVVATIKSYARYWADPDPYKVTGEDLQYIFSQAGCKLVPTYWEAKDSADHYGSNCKLGSGSMVAWCGIFATMVLRYAGMKVYWSFSKFGKEGGGMVTQDAGVGYLSAKAHLSDLSPGDVAVIPDNNHHFIVIDILSKGPGGTLLCIEGNTAGQKIKSRTRPLVDPDPIKRIQGFYHLYR